MLYFLQHLYTDVSYLLQAAGYIGEPAQERGTVRVTGSVTYRRRGRYCIRRMGEPGGANDFNRDLDPYKLRDMTRNGDQATNHCTTSALADLACWAQCCKRGPFAAGGGFLAFCCDQRVFLYDNQVTSTYWEPNGCASRRHH